MSYDSLRRGVIPCTIKSIASPRLPAVVILCSRISPQHACWLGNSDTCTNRTVVKTLKAGSARSIDRHLCQHGSLWQ